MYSYFLQKILTLCLAITILPEVLINAKAMSDDTNLEEVLHSANNQFTANMFSKVAEENPGKSVVLSAFSVMTPLAQLALAAVGPSHDELLKAIGLSDDDVTIDVFSLVDTKLKSIQGVELKIANKVYIPLNYELDSDFATLSRDLFHSEVANVDFLKNDAIANEINTWVEEQTNHRVKDLVDPNTLDRNTRAVLVNALYFKGSWMTSFKKSSTQEHDFYVTKETVVKVPMMNNKAEFKYWESETLKSKILEMPYEGQKSSMLLVLPDDVDGIGALLEQLKNLSILDNEIKNLSEVEVDVNIPKFKIETKTNLIKVLQKMNVKKLFNPDEAKLDKLLEGESDLYVSNAIQKAFIEVNEEGAEAAAANDIEVGIGTIYNPDLRRFVADHPFVFFLKEENNILFSGIYYA